MKLHDKYEAILEFMPEYPEGEDGLSPMAWAAECGLCARCRRLLQEAVRRLQCTHEDVFKAFVYELGKKSISKQLRVSLIKVFCERMGLLEIFVD